MREDCSSGAPCALLEPQKTGDYIDGNTLQNIDTLYLVTMSYMKLTWDEARYKCAGIGGYLPVLETESEENEIKRLILGSRFLPRKDATPVFSRARQQKQSIIYLGKMLSKVGRIFIFTLPPDI